MAARAKKLIARTPRKQHFIDRSAMVASGRASWPINIFLDPYGSGSLEANEKYRGWPGTPSSAESCTLASLEGTIALNPCRFARNNQRRRGLVLLCAGHGLSLTHCSGLTGSP